MALRRSSLLLLGAVLALLCLPASALAQTPPSNDTPPTPAGWRTTPYVVTLAGSDLESAVTMEYQIDSGAISPVPSGTQVTISTQGQLDFKTRAVDSDPTPLDSGWRSEPLWIDMVKPTDDSSATPAAAVSGWHLAPTSFEVRAVDITSGVDHVEWSLDGGATQSGPNGSTVPLSVNGPHLIRTRAVDVAGNVSDWTDHIVRIDAVAPTDATTLPAGWRTTPVDVTVQGTDAHSGVADVSWVVDGGAVTTDSPLGQFTISTDGTHTVQTLVRDEAGNTSGWTLHTVTIDRTAPDNLTDPPDDWVQSADVEIEATDGVSGVDRVEWQVDGGAWQHGPSGSVVQFTTTGEYQLRTRARDVAGNVSLTQLDDVKIDAEAPTNTTGPMPGTEVSSPYQIAVTGDDGTQSGVTTVQWQVGNGPIVTNTPVTITGTGTYELKTRVGDAAGNWSAWRADTIDVNAALGDNVDPVDTTVGASTFWRKAPVTMTVQAEDAGSGVDFIEYQVPGVLGGETAVTKTVTVDTEGVNIFMTRVTDKAENQTAWRSQTVKIDLTRPVDATVIPEGWQSSGTFTLDATDAGPGSGVDEVLYTIDGGPEQAGDPGDSVTVPGDGVHTIVTRVTDNAGWSSSFTTRTLKVDTVDPFNTSDPADTDWIDRLELPLSGTDLHFEEMQWRVDGGEIQHGGPAIIEEDGEYDLETMAVDEAGNDSGWRLDQVKIDGTAPVNTTDPAPAGWRKTAYTTEITGADGAGSGVDEIEVELDGSAASNPVTISGDGVHTLRSRIVDVVGHASDWREETIKIDSAAPQAALACSSAANVWSRVPVTCSVTADGGLSGLGSATLAGADGGTAAVANGAVATVSSDGGHTLRLDAVDGAGNAAAAEATVYVDSTAPAAGLSCAAADGKYACRADASDGASGLVALGWSLDGGAFEAIAAGATFSVTKGEVRLRAVDAAGNETITEAVSLAAIPVGAKVRVSNVPVYLAGRDDTQSMLGALYAVRSANGTVSLDLRPLAVGRGTYRIEIRLKSGKRSKKVKRTYKVGRTGALPRISASLSKAVAKTTITLTVRKKAGKRWRKHAGTRLVLAK